MSRLSDRLIVDDGDSPAPRPAKRKSRKARASPRVASDSLYSTTATPHSDDGYSRVTNEQADDLYASEQKSAATSAPEQTDTDHIDSSLLEAELADGKQRRYSCWGACQGCHMTKTQYALSLLLIVLLVITTVLLIVFLAVIPAIISSTIAAADISVSSVSITAPTNSSFRLNSSFTISNTGSFAATLSPARLSLSHRLPDGSLSDPAGQLDMPAISLSGGDDVVVAVDTDFTVTDQSAFDSFMHATLVQDSVTWHLSSSVTVAGKAAGISLPTYHSIPFEKDVTVPGCGGLNDTTVQSFSLSHPAATTTGNTNLTLLIELVNPSAFTISPLGTLHFLVSYHSVHIGDVYSYNTQLLPGNNTLTMYGSLFQSNTSAESEMIARFVAGEVAVATATAAADASSVPLFNGGIQGLTLATALPGYTGQIIESIAMSSFAISFNSSTPSTALVSSFARASFALPPNVVMPVLGIGSTNITATAYNANAPMGVLSVFDIPAVFEPHTGSLDYINMAIPPSPLQVSADQSAAFQQFAADLLLSQSATMQLQLMAAPVTDTPLGNLSLSIPTTASVSFIGMNRFISPETGLSLMQVLSFDIVRSSPDWLLLDITLNITNPSNVSLSSLGDLRMDLSVNGTRIGGVTVSNFHLPLGTSQQQAVANLSKPTTAAEEAASISLVSAMINQTASNITLHGGLQQLDGSVVAGTDIPLLQQAVSSFATPTVFPGLSQPLIDHFDVGLPLNPYLYMMLGGCTQLYINTTMYVRNPFSTYMYITAVDIEVFINPNSYAAAQYNITSSFQVKMGDWRVDMSDNPLVVPPHTTANATAVGPFLIRLTLGGVSQAAVHYVYDLVFAKFGNKSPQLDSVGTIRTNLTSAAPDQGGAAVAAFEQRVHVDARNVTTNIQSLFEELPENPLPPVPWGGPILNNGTCSFGCKTQCTVPCYCDAVLCRHGNCNLGYVNSIGGMWGEL